MLEAIKDAVQKVAADVGPAVVGCGRGSGVVIGKDRC